MGVPLPHLHSTMDRCSSDQRGAIATGPSLSLMIQSSGSEPKIAVKHRKQKGKNSRGARGHSWIFVQKKRAESLPSPRGADLDPFFRSLALEHCIHRVKRERRAARELKQVQIPSLLSSSCRINKKTCRSSPADLQSLWVGLRLRHRQSLHFPSSGRLPRNKA